MPAPAPARADPSPSSRSRSPATSPEAAAAAPKLGTGHGEREYSHVENTEFQRRQTQPDEIIRIRYDSLDNLVAMGIVTQSRPVIPVANPFPASPQQQYVPDPPQGSAGTRYSLKSVTPVGRWHHFRAAELNVSLGAARTIAGHAPLL